MGDQGMYNTLFVIGCVMFGAGITLISKNLMDISINLFRINETLKKKRGKEK